MKIIKVTQKNTLKVRVPAGFTGFTAGYCLVPAGFTGFTAGFWSAPVLVITQANCSFDWLRGHAKFMVQMGYMERILFLHINNGARSLAHLTSRSHSHLDFFLLQHSISYLRIYVLKFYFMKKCSCRESNSSLSIKSTVSYPL